MPDPVLERFEHWGTEAQVALAEINDQRSTLMAQVQACDEQKRRLESVLRALSPQQKAKRLPQRGLSEERVSRLLAYMRKKGTDVTGIEVREKLGWNSGSVSAGFAMLHKRGQIRYVGHTKRQSGKGVGSKTYIAIPEEHGADIT